MLLYLKYFPNIKQNRFRKMTSCELKIRVRARQKWDCNISILSQNHHHSVGICFVLYFLKLSASCCIIQIHSTVENGTVHKATLSSFKNSGKITMKILRKDGDEDGNDQNDGHGNGTLSSFLALKLWFRSFTLVKNFSCSKSRHVIPRMYLKLISFCLKVNACATLSPTWVR